MTDPQYTQPPRPPIVQIGPTEMAGAWLEEVRRKLEEQGLQPALAARVADEVARLSPSLVADQKKVRATARLYLVLGLLVMASAIGSGISNYLLQASAVVYACSVVAALWGAILCCRGVVLKRQWMLFPDRETKHRTR